MPNPFSPISLGECIKAARAGPFTLTETAHEANRALPRHCHEHANIAFVLGGTLTETFDRRSFEGGPGSVVVKPPGEAHANRYGAAGMRCLVIEVGRDRLESTYGVRKAFATMEHVRGGPLTALAMRAYREFRRADDLTSLAIEGLMLEMIAELARRTSGRPAGRPPAWLERARDLLHDELAESHTLASVAAAVGVHPTHLAREFRRAYRSTMGAYLRGLRIEFACRKLAESGAPLFEIAAESGFADHSHFARTFRERTGMTPGEYRRSVRGR